MSQSKLPRMYIRLAMKITCAVTFAFSGVPLRAEMYQCVGPDGSKTFSDQPCPSGTRAKASAPMAAPQNKTLPKMSIVEASAARAAADKEFMIKYYAAMTPACQKFAKAKPDDQATRLSADEQAARDGFKSNGCQAMVAPVQAEYKNKLIQIDAAIDRPSARTPECRKLAGQAASIYMKGVSTEGQVRMFEQASRMMDEQKCDGKLLGEAMEANLAAYQAEVERLEKNPCEMKRRLQDALRLRQSSSVTSAKSDIDYLEKQVAELAKKCP